MKLSRNLIDINNRVLVAEGPRASITLLKFWVKVPGLGLLSHASNKTE